MWLTDDSSVIQFFKFKSHGPVSLNLPLGWPPLRKTLGDRLATTNKHVRTMRRPGRVLSSTVVPEVGGNGNLPVLSKVLAV